MVIGSRGGKIAYCKKCGAKVIITTYRKVFKKGRKVSGGYRK